MSIQTRLDTLRAIINERKKLNPICYEVIYTTGARRYIDSFTAMITVLGNTENIRKMIYYSELGNSKDEDEKAKMSRALIADKFETNSEPIPLAIYQAIEEQKAR